MVYVSVKDGTRAGIRTVRPAPKPWQCPGCSAELAAHWAKCPNCKIERPS